jgi:hypothetical protein
MRGSILELQIPVHYAISAKFQKHISMGIVLPAIPLYPGRIFILIMRVQEQLIASRVMKKIFPLTIIPANVLYAIPR